MKLPHKTQLILAFTLAVVGTAAGLVYQEQRIKVDLNIGEAQSTIIFQSSFEELGGPGPTNNGFSDASPGRFVWTGSVARDCTRSNAGNCSAKTVGGTIEAEYGGSATEVCVSWQQYNDPGYVLPAGTSGLHMTRVGDVRHANTVEVDLDINTGADTPRILIFGGDVPSGHSHRQLFTNYKPAAPENKARWVKWQIYAKMNTVGQTDGILRLYIDGNLVPSSNGVNGLSEFADVAYRSSPTTNFHWGQLTSNSVGSWPSTNVRWIDQYEVRTGACGSTQASIDTTAPSVSISSPSAGASVSGTITVSASASDNVGVSGVQFLLNGSPLGSEDTTSPYSVSWNTTTVANGTYTLSARARDAAGNQTTSGGVSVTVNNQTSSSCLNPSPLPSGFATPCPVLSLSASTVSKTGSLTVTATPPSSLASYQYKTIYLSDPNWACSGKAGGFWCPLTLGGTSDSQAPAYVTKNQGGSLTLGSSVLPNLASGVHYLLSWDWAWDSSANCYKGPGLNTCNTGAWRIQQLNVQ